MAGSTSSQSAKILQGKVTSFCSATKAPQDSRTSPQRPDSTRSFCTIARGHRFATDGAGSTGLLIAQNGLPPVLLKNDSGNDTTGYALRCKGENDNKSAIGSKVELFAGALRQKWEIAAASRLLRAKGLARSSQDWAWSAAPTWCGCCGPRAYCRMNSKFPHTKMKSSPKSTVAAAPALSYFNVWNGETIRISRGYDRPRNRRSLDRTRISATLRIPDEYLKVTGSLVQPQEGADSFPHAGADGRARLPRQSSGSSPSITSGLMSKSIPTSVLRAGHRFPHKYKVIASRGARRARQELGTTKITIFCRN